MIALQSHQLDRQTTSFRPSFPSPSYSKFSTRAFKNSNHADCLHSRHQTAKCSIPRHCACESVANGHTCSGLSAQLLESRQTDQIRHSRRSILLASIIFTSCASPASAYLVDESVSTRVFEQASSSVVSIVNVEVDKGESIEEGVGTGVVWHPDGYIVTNYHCISKLDKSGQQLARVVIKQPSGETLTYNAQVVGSDSMNDIAVLKIDPAGQTLLQPLQVGTSSDLKVGQYVFAIGNTFGLTKTLSAGVVSGLNRSMPSPVGTRIYGVIQTDASISAGNSGGPLLDSSGRMVGLNTATFTRSGTGRGSGVNFALPVDLVRQVVPQLIVYGNARGKRV